MTRLPEVPDALSARDTARTATAIAAVQQPDGGIPWAVGEHIDAWNHVEGAMALLIGGEVEAAEAAYEWCLATQRPDGTWPIKVVGDRIVDPGAETNMCAYLAVGAWHHWLLRRDRAFADRLWPAVRGGLDFVAGMQLPWGGIGWARGADGSTYDTALLAGSSSIYQALRAGTALADLVGDPQPEWEIACGGLRHALEEHRDRFLDKRRYSMDWYYPILAGPLRGDTAREVLAARWPDFVVDGLGCRCVEQNPWVTGAETCELVVALDNLGDAESWRRARDLFAWTQRMRHEDGMYWTGYVYTADLNWPQEQTTFTSAAVLLAADALSRATPANGIFRGDCLPAPPRALARACGCAGVPAASGH